jgi:hypothetical protein
MEPNQDTYHERVLKYLKGLAPDTRVKIASISTEPKRFTETVKKIIDLRQAEVEFSNDYLYITKKEEIDYERFKKQ